ncbi:COG1470 family protein [Paenarthrobacter nitroguajacolicus]|uniref:COG1470 family protein n=1 Tax=Paenarthrobacter nitroguajacolicus TaxID=211146 RepID=UPI000B2D41D9|nr:hypothetical protein [Paenarthrobacter nitroguajacolicus]
MDPRPKRAASPHLTGPLHGAGLPLRALFLVLVVALMPMVTLAASGGQDNAVANAASVSKGITVTLSPSSRTVDQGQSASYTVAASSVGGFTGQVTFSVVGLPTGTAAAWQPSSVVLSSGSTAQATLTVTTAPNTPAGKTGFTLKATSGTTQASSQAQLHVLEAKRTFDVSGSVDGMLAPGVSRPLDLQVSNPSNKSIAVTNLTVAISQVVRTTTAVAANLPCTTADYKLSQYSGQYPLTVVPGTRSLSALGVSQSTWPRIQMLDTAQLQDGCKGATLKLTYSGTGQAN